MIVTEIMNNPAVLADADGEYFELHNLTGATLRLAGCLVEGSTDVGFAIDPGLEIDPYGHRVFATDSALYQGFVADQQWADADYNLSNSGDTVRLVCNGVTVDEVVYDSGATFPSDSGAAKNLDPSAYDAVSNDDGASWCSAPVAFNGDFGSPGALNPMCPAPVSYPIDFCRLQFPTSIDEVEGTTVDVFGRVYVAGLTDLSGVNDPAVELIADVGHGADGTDPAVDPSWVWSNAFPNAAYGPLAPAYEANNDEYFGSIAVPSPPGSYDFAARFSGDGGLSWTYCDGDGSTDGYDPADAGQLTSQAGGPPPPLLFSEYVEGSSNNKALEIYNPPGADADLTGCEVRFYFNGSATVGGTATLVGLVPADQVWTVCENDLDPLVFDPASCDQQHTGTWFNGDDAVELVCRGVTLDVIGQIGVDPGSEWAGSGVGTQDETIRRSCAVTTGDTNGADVFDPSVEWTTSAQDDFSGFGVRGCP